MVGRCIVIEFILFSILYFLLQGPTEKRSAKEFDEYVNDLKDSLIGGTCLIDDNCSAVSYCDTDERMCHF